MRNLLLSAVAVSLITILPETAPGQTSLDSLVAELSDGDEQAKLSAADQLAKLGPGAVATVPALVVALSDKSPEVRQHVVHALSLIGIDAIGEPKRSDVLRQVAAMVEAPQAGTPLRVESALALIRLTPVNEQLAKTTMPVLVEGMQNAKAAVRRAAAEAAGRLGKQAAAAEAPLRELTKDENETVRAAALAALEQIGVVVDLINRAPENRRR